MAKNLPKPYQVQTQFLYDGKWRSASDHVGCDTYDEAIAKGPQLVADQRKTLGGGLVSFADSKVPRRYVVRQLEYVSEPM